MHVDLVHRRRSSLDWSELITCPHCGNQARGRVSVSAVGEGTAHGGMLNQDAHDRAGVDAFDKASSEGAALLRRAKCPACGKRGDGISGSFFSAAGLGVAMAVLGYRDLGEAAVVLAVVMVAPLGLLFAWWRTRKADAHVSWERGLEVPPHLASPGWAAAQAPRAPEPRHTPQWETPEPPPANPEPAPESSGLELDLDRSWNKKKS